MNYIFKLEEITLSLGKDILAKRKVARLTQRQVAERAGIHQNTLLDFEREKAGPDKATYKKLCAVITELSEPSVEAQ